MPFKLAEFYVILATIVSSAIGQTITTPARRFEAKVGESVELSCHVEGLDLDNTVVLWRRGKETVISMDNEMVIGDNRFSVYISDSNYTLTINSLEPYDTADYTCEITSTPPREITHRLQVNVAPLAKLAVDSPLLVRVGEDVSVKCSSTGNPPPTLKWHRKSGGKMPHHAHVTSHGLLRIASAQLVDSGSYECVASNGILPESTAVVNIRVEANDNDAASTSQQAKPWVETDKVYIPVKTGTDVNLTCKYDGEPAPDTEWLYNSFRINSYDSKFRTSVKYSTRHTNHSQTILALKDIQEDNFGDYTCRIANHLGTVQATIHLSGRPGPPVLLLREGNTLSWTVESAEPITEYQVLYRLTSADTWSGKQTYRSTKDDQQGDYWEKSVELDYLKEDSEYEVQVQAKNKLGWGSFARDYVTVKTPKAENGKAQGRTSNALSTRASLTTFLFALVWCLRIR